MSLYSASNCGVKSLGLPGTEYSYGPRWAWGSCVKLPCGGGEGAAHSMVVASHGLSPAGLPFHALQKKLTMNGIWNSPSIQAPIEETTFQCWTCCPKA